MHIKFEHSHISNVYRQHRVGAHVYSMPKEKVQFVCGVDQVIIKIIFLSILLSLNTIFTISGVLNSSKSIIFTYLLTIFASYHKNI